MDVRVYNATGALVMSTVLKPGSPELNLSGLSDGLYALVIQGGNSRYTSQVAVFHGR
jgi:predicted Zn-dependent protease